MPAPRRKVAPRSNEPGRMIAAELAKLPLYQQFIAARARASTARCAAGAGVVGDGGVIVSAVIGRPLAGQRPGPASRALGIRTGSGLRAVTASNRGPALGGRGPVPRTRVPRLGSGCFDSIPWALPELQRLQPTAGLYPWAGVA